MSPVAQYVLQTGLTLLGVLGIAWFILYASKRLGVQQQSGPIQLLGRLPLEPRRAVCLVKIGERVLILGTSEAGISKLSELAFDDLPPGTSKTNKTFGSVLSQALTQKPSAMAPAGSDKAASTRRIPQEDES